MNKISKGNRSELFIWQNGVFRKTVVDEVMYLEASGNYCYVKRADGVNILLSVTLLKASEAFPVEYFIRISRSHVINIRYVDAISGNALYMKEKRFTISPSHRKELFSIFCFLGSTSKKIFPE